jgi:hypothetical protein
MIDDLPDHWQLPAAESQVLLSGPDTPDDWVIKLGLKELVLRRILTVSTVRERRYLILRRNTDIVSRTRKSAVGLSRPLRAMLDVFPKATFYHGGTTGIPVRQAALEVLRWYRAGGGFVKAEILPEMQRLGLYEQVSDQGILRWRLTPEGEQALIDLRVILERGRAESPTWETGNRAGAAAFIGLAGPAVLLLGNPLPWIWVLLMESLSEDQSLAIPGEDPFAGPVAVEQIHESAAGGGGVVVVGGRPEDSKEPAEAVDEGVDSASDAFGDGGGGDGDGE